MVTDAMHRAAIVYASSVPWSIPSSVIEGLLRAAFEEFQRSGSSNAAPMSEANKPAEPVALVDGLTPHQFALRELYEFQQATGCDTAAEFVAVAPAAPAPAGWKMFSVPVQWTPGADWFKDWAANWFGPDVDDEHIRRAVADLLGRAPRMEFNKSLPFTGDDKI